MIRKQLERIFELRRGVHISGGMEGNILNIMKFRQIMRNDVTTVPKDMIIPDMINPFKIKDASYLHVADENNDLRPISFLVGMLGL